MVFFCYFIVFFGFRLDKPNVLRLAEVLELEPKNFRGRPLSAVQQVCVALNFYAGGHFTRVAGLCQGVSQKAAWWAIHRVTEKLCLMKDVFICMPEDHELAETARNMKDRFGLPGFAFAVDGVVVKFVEAPRKVPVGNVQQDYWNRKMCYAMNVQIVGNDKRLILDINTNWHGGVHDARVWKNSSVKTIIERQDQYLLAGDSGYPISPVLITPYLSNEALDDSTKRDFNRRHSGLRTVMSENIFGIWKRRFPVVNQLRANRENARKIVIATAILHNICILWGDEDPDGPLPPTIPAAVVEDADNLVGVHQHNSDAIRLAGQMVRDGLRLSMGPRGRR